MTALSGVGFFARGLGSLFGAEWLKPLNVARFENDSVFSVANPGLSQARGLSDP